MKYTSITVNTQLNKSRENVRRKTTSTI